MYSRYLSQYPWELTNQEYEYLQKLPEDERIADIQEATRFLKYMFALDPHERERDSFYIDTLFYEANEFSYKTNKILHENIGFDERIAKDFFFRRYHAVANKKKWRSIYSLEIDLWDEFTIDRITPKMFKGLGKLIELEDITKIYINAKSIKDGISEDLLKYTPNIEYIKIDITDRNVQIPSSITNLPSYVESL